MKFNLFVEQGDGLTFPGTVCHVWEIVEKVKEGILWDIDTTSSEIHKEISREGCWPMVQTGKCGDNALKKSGKVWS